MHGKDMVYLHLLKDIFENNNPAVLPYLVIM